MSRLVLFAAAAALALAAPAAAQAPKPRPAPAKAAPARPAASPITALKVDIPYTKFVLANGLTLIVHEDHKAPIVAVNVWYHVGSKNEPPGRSGFAHLFEHLMFNGSEHFNDDFFKATQKLGATDQNGTTNFDRTNYFQNVPKEALDSILWLESDRMGHLLGAVDQARLDEQRGVVQNEKRQGENQPYGRVFNRIVEVTYPDEHPYGHTVIGSMEDLNAAKLDDVREWFRTYYGPSNAVIVLAGDITPDEARAKVEKYFGGLPPGPPVAHFKASIAKMSGYQRDVMEDRVAQPRLYKIWNVPGWGTRDSDLLAALADVLAGDKTSRLTKRLVFDEQVATDVQVFPFQNEIGGQFWVMVNAKPGGDLEAMERAVDQEISKLLAEGPTAAEIEKAKTRAAADLVRGLERVGGFGGKSDTLARSEVFLGDPDAWKRTLDVIRTATPMETRDAGRRWLSDGAYALHVVPYPSYAAKGPDADRKAMPQPGDVAAAKFPAVERATLGNGLKVMLVERHELPTVNLRLVVNTGYAADFASEPAGLGGLTMNLLDEGTATRDGLALADELARLGATLNTGGGAESAFVEMSALKPTLGPALDIFADVVQRPAFRPADFTRERARQVAALQSAKRQPTAVANRVAGALVYGADHPYGRVPTEASLGGITREQVAGFHQRWIRPDASTLIVVGDVTMAELKPKLEAALAGWRPGAPQRMAIAPPPRPAKPALYLVDQPGAVQSVIMAASGAPPRNAPDEVGIDAFNSVLGGSFMSRLNMNLREGKSWSYGAFSSVAGGRGARLFRAFAPVQTDKTAEALAEIRREVREIVGDKRVTAAELEGARDEIGLALAGRWETGARVTADLSDIALYGLPEDYYATYGARLRAINLDETSRAGGLVVPDQNLVWVVVGDRAKIEAGLRALNLGPIQMIDADGKPAP